MSGCLPDVNVLIALLDPTHVHHEPAHSWFADRAPDEWVTVPITENGVLRIVSHPSYPNHQPLPAVTTSLRSLTAVPGHRFEPDAISLLDVLQEPLLSSSQVTDAYLVALARALDLRLVTFDRRIAAGSIPGAAAVLDVIG